MPTDSPIGPEGDRAYRVTDETHRWRHDPDAPSGLILGPATVFVADVDDLADLGDVADPDGPWQMVHPVVPDFPPADA